MHATVLLRDSVRNYKYQQLNKFKHSSLITDCNRKVFQTNSSGEMNLTL